MQQALRALIVAHDCPTKSNKHAFRSAKSVLAAAVRVAKSDWARTLENDCMQYKTDPVKSWKAVRTLEKGLTHHHAKCRTVCMQKMDGTKSVTDKENAE
eukprot:13689448-Ditylum_brightwellii.AAC.1